MLSKSICLCLAGWVVVASHDPMLDVFRHEAEKQF